jgi:GT2 family glycosyltransferase
LGQTHPPTEIIVVNDGSTDNTTSAALSFGSRVRYFEQANRGPAAARNLGTLSSAGEFIAYLDADDLWEPQFLSRCIDFMNRHPGAVAVGTGLRFRVPGKPDLFKPTAYANRTGPVEPFLIERFFPFWRDHDHIRTGSCVMRRSVLLKAGFQREDLRICEDLELWALLGTYGLWGFIPEPLWVCESDLQARRTGWKRKYALRRRFCPTVEQWEKRLVGRISQCERDAYRVCRGRVAGIIAQQQVLAGHSEDAWATMRCYGSDMPANRVTRLLRWGAGNRLLTWGIACALLRLHDECRPFLKGFPWPRETGKVS